MDYEQFSPDALMVFHYGVAAQISTLEANGNPVPADLLAERNDLRRLIVQRAPLRPDEVAHAEPWRRYWSHSRAAARAALATLEASLPDHRRESARAHRRDVAQTRALGDTLEADQLEVVGPAESDATRRALAAIAWLRANRA